MLCVWNRPGINQHPDTPLPLRMGLDVINYNGCGLTAHFVIFGMNMCHTVQWNLQTKDTLQPASLIRKNVCSSEVEQCINSMTFLTLKYIRTPCLIIELSSGISQLHLYTFISLHWDHTGLPVLIIEAPLF